MKPLFIVAALICFATAVGNIGSAISDYTEKEKNVQRLIALPVGRHAAFDDLYAEIEKQKETIDREILIAVVSGVAGLTLLGVAIGKKKPVQPSVP